jgi:hypothetical protein
MSRKNHSADSLSLASNANDTTGPGDVSNDGSVFAAGQTSSRLLADIRRMAPMIAARAAEIEAARRCRAYASPCNSPSNKIPGL